MLEKCPFTHYLISHFISHDLALIPPPFLHADFPLKPWPRLPVAVLLVWKFSSVPAEMRVSVCSATDIGDLPKATLPFCL